jgi:hypothetical protein
MKIVVNTNRKTTKIIQFVPFFLKLFMLNTTFGAVGPLAGAETVSLYGSGSTKMMRRGSTTLVLTMLEERTWYEPAFQYYKHIHCTFKYFILYFQICVTDRNLMLFTRQGLGQCVPNGKHTSHADKSFIFSSPICLLPGWSALAL